MKRFLVVPLLVTFAFGGTITPIPSETEKKIKQSVESREYTTAVAELGIAINYPDPQSNRAHRLFPKCDGVNCQWIVIPGEPAA